MSPKYSSPSLCSTGNSLAALSALALLTHSSLFSGLLFFPISVLLLSSPASSLISPKVFTQWRAIPLYGILFGLLLAAFGLLSTFVVGDTEWLKSTWGAS